MKIQKTLGAGVMSLGLVLGMAGFAGAAPARINTTGPRSNNVIRNHTNHRVDIDNDTDLDVQNRNTQTARTGDATVRDNTRGGSAETGTARNTNSFTGRVDVDNTVSAGAALEFLGNSNGGNNSAEISDTGPRSDNRIINDTRTNVDIDNDTDINVTNSSTQTATSGDATVRDNTRGGDATSGDASNTNSTSLTFRVSN